MTIEQEWATFREQIAERHVAIRGERWSYLCVPGSAGPTVVLLPGGLNCPEAFFPLFVGLGRAARVIAVRYPALTSVAALLDGLLALLEREDAGELRVFGTSLGGALAQCLARRDPGRIGALVLANTFAPNPAARPHLRRNARAVAWLPAPALRWLTARRVPGLAAALPSTERAFGREFLRDCLAATATRRWLVSQYRLLDDYCGYDPCAPGTPPRTLIVRSDDDPLVARLTATPLTACYPRARVRTFRAGHLPFLTARDAFRRSVLPILLGDGAAVDHHAGSGAR